MILFILRYCYSSEVNIFLTKPYQENELGILHKEIQVQPETFQ